LTVCATLRAHSGSTAELATRCTDIPTFVSLSTFVGRSGMLMSSRSALISRAGEVCSASNVALIRRTFEVSSLVEPSGRQSAETDAVEGAAVEATLMSTDCLLKDF
jgi:hypothetical protein